MRDRFAEGARIGDYTVVCELGTEETGVVYEASHVVLPRRARLKVMHGGTWVRQTAMQMIREACMLEALQHPGVPRVYECGVLPDRRPWTATEWIEGVTLATQMENGPLPLADVVVMLRDVAELLVHAHSRGIVHRKLTAEAIVRTPNRPTGVVVQQWDQSSSVDSEVRIAIDTRDDVHALGVIAFIALAGSLPSNTRSTAECCPGVPLELASLVDHMLTPDPTMRPSSEDVRNRARWLAATIEPLVVERPRWTPPRGVQVTSTDSIPVIEDEGFSIRISRTRSR